VRIFLVTTVTTGDCQSDHHRPTYPDLDESTAGPDPVSEVLERLLNHRQGKTTILITHRPSVINRADWVVFLEQGQLQIQGTLSDLYSVPTTSVFITLK